MITREIDRHERMRIPRALYACRNKNYVVKVIFLGILQIYLDDQAY